jgi:hypothetical protein
MGISGLLSVNQPETFDNPNSQAEIEKVESLIRQKLEQLIRLYGICLWI